MCGVPGHLDWCVVQEVRGGPGGLADAVAEQAAVGHGVDVDGRGPLCRSVLVPDVPRVHEQVRHGVPAPQNPCVTIAAAVGGCCWCCRCTHSRHHDQTAAWGLPKAQARTGVSAPCGGAPVVGAAGGLLVGLVDGGVAVHQAVALEVLPVAAVEQLLVQARVPPPVVEVVRVLTCSDPTSSHVSPELQP
jgi:hypothetical protein